MTIEDRIMNLCGGNPGAMRVTIALLNTYGESALDMLEDQAIKGPNIWLLYKDECGENLETAYAVLEAGTAYATLQGNPYFEEN